MSSIAVSPLLLAKVANVLVKYVKTIAFQVLIGET